MVTVILVVIGLLVVGTRLCEHNHRIFGYTCYLAVPAVIAPAAANKLAEHWLRYAAQSNSSGVIDLLIVCGVLMCVRWHRRHSAI
jgi:hypothetical protein